MGKIAKIPSPALQETDYKRLALACRRGNTETEQLLHAFLPHLSELSQEECQQFEQLLTQEEHALFLWLMKPNRAPVAFQGLIHKIRKRQQLFTD